jgi:hypothetical protein
MPLIQGFFQHGGAEYTAHTEALRATQCPLYLRVEKNHLREYLVQ